MSRVVLCTCRSHCLTFNPETQVYEGEGTLIPKSTAANHRQDDLNSQALDSFTENIATQVLNYSYSPPPELDDEDPPPLGFHGQLPPSDDLYFVLEAEAVHRCAWAPANRSLVFAAVPSPTLQYQYPSTSEMRIPNREPYALNPEDNTNAAYLQNESRLCEILVSLVRRPASEPRERLLVRVCEGLAAMEHHKETEWNRQRTGSIARRHGYSVVETGTYPMQDSLERHSQRIPKQGPYFNNSLPQNRPLAISFLTILILHLFFRTPRRAARVLIGGLRGMLMATRQPLRIINLLPQDPRTIVKKFDLDPRTTSYLQCPACYALYAFPGTGFHHLPPDTIEHCTHRSTPESAPCGVPLWRDHRVGATILKVPSRKYVHQSLKEWVGRLLTRPGVEDVLDAAYDQPASDRMTDVWDSPVLRKFRDVDNTPFFAKHGHEARLAFSLGADSFHPLGSLEAKQTMSATAIFMVLLNFPKEQRFKYKNMYLVGVIPGPSKPSLEQINHALILLVRELLEFWKGVYYTKTHKFPNGRLSKGALMALVCDMLAARQVAGFGSATSTFFCTFCLLTIQDIENTNKDTWPPRELHKHLECARQWRDCQSERERERLFRLHGIRWSALLDLPYWNPMVSTILDSMHGAYLGLSQTYCRKVLVIDLSVEGGDGSLFHVQKPTPRPSEPTLRKWLQIIQTNPRNLVEQLTGGGITKSVLWHICVDNGLRHAGGKLALAKAISDWVHLNLYSLYYPAELWHRDPGFLQTKLFYQRRLMKWKSTSLLHLGLPKMAIRSDRRLQTQRGYYSLQMTLKFFDGQTETPFGNSVRIVI